MYIIENSLPARILIRTLTLALAAIIGLAAIAPAFAGNGTDTWTGNAGDNNWATGGNWTGVNAPPIAGDTPAFGAQGAGSLTLNNDIASTTSFLGLTFNASAPAFTLTGNSITTTGGIVDNSTDPETVNLPIILSGTHSVNATPGGAMTLGGVLSGSSAGITKTGGGTVVLNGSAVNTYTGTTTANAGMLAENFANLGSTGNLISSSSPLAFGGGIFQIEGNSSSTSSQTFASTTLNAGASTLTVGPNGGPNPTVALGGFTTSGGGTLVINGPATSTGATTASGQTGSAGNGSTIGLQAAAATVTTTSGTANQVFMSAASGAEDYYCYGTVGLYDFAAVSGSSPFTITGLSQISSSTSGLGTAGDGSYYLATTAFDSNNGVFQTHFDDIAASFSPSPNTTSIGGLRFNYNGALTLALPGGSTYTFGAILVTPNVGANNDTIFSNAYVEPGWRSSSNSGELAIYQNNTNGFLILNCLLADGKTAGGSWSQNGAGTVVYTVIYTNSFTGTLTLNGGVSEIISDSDLGAAGTGATVNMNGGTVLGNATFTMDSSGSHKRGIALGNNGGSLAAVTGDTMTVDGIISGANPLTIGIPASSANGGVTGQVPGTGSGTANASVLASGTVALTGANTYTGGTILDGGILSIASGGLGTGGINFNGGTLQWASGNTNDISSQTITLNSAGGTLDVNGNTVTLANPIGNNGAGTMTVESTTGGGVLSLKGANTYTGGTMVSSGTLNANNTSGSATGTNIVTIQSGAGLGGSGAIAGSVTWQPGGFGSFFIGLQLTVGAVTLNNNSVIVNVPGSTPLGAGVYALMNYTAAGSTGSFNTNTPTYTGAGVTPGMTSAISTSGGVVTLTVTAVGGINRTWVGDGLTNAWDYTSVNWLDGPVPDYYSDGDLVTFDDTGSNTPPINLTTALQPASVLVNAVQNYTFGGAGQISGTTALTKTNSGTLTLLTANNYSGATIIGQGTLQLGNGTTFGSVGTNIILNTGSLVLDLPGNNTFANVISGSGSVAQAGPGVLTLSASNSYSGGTTISAGTLQLSSSGWFGSGNITDYGTLTFNRSVNSAISASISGSGSVSLTGSGTITLSGNNTYNNGTTISAGTLLVNSSAGSGPVVVNSSGTLGGGGTIAGAVTINSGGTLSPGNPVGTFTINSDLTVNSGATMNLTLGSGSDKVVVGGNLSLNGTMNITAGTGFTTTTYTLFTYSGTLTLGSLTLNLPSSTSATLSTNTPGQVNLVVQTLRSDIPAFPGALGFGQGAFGARFGTTVYHVSNTNDSGAGSFRDAVSGQNRFVVFDVGGTISLASAVSCSSSLTIAGQTAPGGIAIIGHEVSFSVRSNCIVRYLRIRPGSIASSTEDGINMGDATNMMFDHDSIEFAPYNNIDAHGNYTAGNEITMQSCILADPIGQQFNAHTEASNNTFSWFYNIFSSGHDRNPLAKVNTIFINNVIYNYQAGYTVADTGGIFSHDIINNYFITGPATTSAGDDFFQFDSNQSVYSAGNLLDSADNGTLGGGATAPGGVVVLSSPWSPFSTNTPIFSTSTAYRYDVSMSGAFPADQIDENVLGDVTSLGTQGMGGGLWTSQTSTGLGNDGYGVITPGIAPVDTDGDGIPDYYEEATGSNPNVADSLTPGVGGYTKLENYLNWLAAPNAVTTTRTPVSVDLWQYTAGFTNDNPVYSVSFPSNGTVTLNSGHIVNFMPNVNFNGLASFQFAVRDSDGTAMTNSVSICVTPYGAVTNNVAPVFGTISASSVNNGYSIVFGGTGGITNGNFILLGSTNAAAPLSNWIPLATNEFDANGDFDFTNPVNAAGGQDFYILELP